MGLSKRNIFHMAIGPREREVRKKPGCYVWVGECELPHEKNDLMLLIKVYTTKSNGSKTMKAITQDHPRRSRSKEENIKISDMK